MLEISLKYKLYEQHIEYRSRRDRKHHIFSPQMDSHHRADGDKLGQAVRGHEYWSALEAVDHEHSEYRRR